MDSITLQRISLPVIFQSLPKETPATKADAVDDSQFEFEFDDKFELRDKLADQIVHHYALSKSEPIKLPEHLLDQAAIFTNQVLRALPSYVLRVGYEMLVALEANRPFVEVWSIATRDEILSPRSCQLDPDTSLLREHEKDVLSIPLFFHHRGYAFVNFLDGNPFGVVKEKSIEAEDSTQEDLPDPNSPLLQIFKNFLERIPPDLHQLAWQAANIPTTFAQPQWWHNPSQT